MTMSYHSDKETKVYCFYVNGYLEAWTLDKEYAKKYAKLTSLKWKKVYKESKFILPTFMNMNKELMITEVILTDENDEVYELLSTPKDDEEITQFIEKGVRSLEILMYLLNNDLLDTETLSVDDEYKQLVNDIYEELTKGNCYNVDTLEIHMYNQCKKKGK